MKRGQIAILFFLIFSGSQIFAQSYNFEKTSFVYKQVGGDSVEMTMYLPTISGNSKLPAIVFFFGGGWVGGNPNHFQMQAEYLATRGIVVICPDYRTRNRFGTTPFESVKDAKSAMRYLKINGSKMRIDTSKIVAAGGSAGGHLAACTAIIKNVNEETDNLYVSSVPFALVLFNPVVDTGKRGYGQTQMQGREFEISPIHHITSNVPPTLIMHGKADTTVPYENVVRFKQVMKQAGNRCVLKGYKKQTHGFFNYGKNPKYFKKTLQKTEKFLDEYELLRGESWVKKYCKEL
jgi:acetyl esterase/lipase